MLPLQVLEGSRMCETWTYDALLQVWNCTAWRSGTVPDPATVAAGFEQALFAGMFAGVTVLGTAWAAKKLLTLIKEG